MDGYAVLSSLGYLNGVFQPCPTCPRTRGIDVKKFWFIYLLITRDTLTKMCRIYGQMAILIDLV